VSTEQKAFQCELIGPAGKLLNCRVTSVVFPAHDGQVGILCDHMPMLSQLGMGVMRVAPLPEGDGKASAAPLEREFLVDGGFALVAENSVTVIAYEAMALPDVKAETIRSLIEKVNKNLASEALSTAQRAHETERLRILQRISQSLAS